jgi:hypothetical protein
MRNRPPQRGRHGLPVLAGRTGANGAALLILEDVQRTGGEKIGEFSGPLFKLAMTL